MSEVNYACTLNLIITTDSSLGQNLRNLTSKRKQHAHAVVAQIKPEPNQHSKIDREQNVTEDWVADSHVSSNGAAQISC